MNAQSYIEGVVDGMARAFVMLRSGHGALPTAEEFTDQVDFRDIIRNAPEEIPMPTDTLDLRESMLELIAILDGGGR